MNNSHITRSLQIFFNHHSTYNEFVVLKDRVTLLLYYKNKSNVDIFRIDRIRSNGKENYYCLHVSDQVVDVIFHRLHVRLDNSSSTGTLTDANERIVYTRLCHSVGQEFSALVSLGGMFIINKHTGLIQFKLVEK